MAEGGGGRALGWAVAAALVFPVAALLYEAVAIRWWPHSDVPGGGATPLLLGLAAAALSAGAAGRALAARGRDADTRIARVLAGLVMAGWLVIVALTVLNLLTGPPADPVCAVPFLVCD